MFKTCFRSLPALIVLAVVSPDIVRGEQLTFSLMDMGTDRTLDVTRLDLTFDNETGEWELLFHLNEDTPLPERALIEFFADFYNPDADSFVSLLPDILDRRLRPENVVSPTLVRYTGTHLRLTSWCAGDRVATNGLVFGGFPLPGPSGPFLGAGTVIIDDSETIFMTGISGQDFWGYVFPASLFTGFVDLADAVMSLELTPGLENSLLNKLAEANAPLIDLNHQNDHLAGNKLLDFIDQVEAQSGKAISTSEAEALVARSEEVLLILVNTLP